VSASLLSGNHLVSVRSDNSILCGTDLALITSDNETGEKLEVELAIWDANSKNPVWDSKDFAGEKGIPNSSSKVT
jgi:hypothetical protein